VYGLDILYGLYRMCSIEYRLHFSAKWTKGWHPVRSLSVALMMYRPVRPTAIIWDCISSLMKDIEGQ